MGPNDIIFFVFFLMLSFKPAFSLSSFTFIKRLFSSSSLSAIGVVSSAYQEKAMAIHSSTLTWKIPWLEKPGRLQSMGSHRVGHDWATSLHFRGTESGQISSSLHKMENPSPLAVVEWASTSLFLRPTNLRNKNHQGKLFKMRLPGPHSQKFRFTKS